MVHPYLPPPYVESHESAWRRRSQASGTVGDLQTPEAWAACMRYAAPYALASGLATAWIASAGRGIEPRDFLAALGGALLGWVTVSVLDATII